ncbi:MAG: hypothetical protein H7235_03230 [Bdellovibrionaceae bacterium]|nr:hypothetical protein [Pseudobdellovibrionaceae bacterium]
MKAFITSAVFTLALVGFTNFAKAEETKTTTVEHESHHVEETTSTPKDTNKMDMESMMHDCMKMHKDQKVCHQENMKSCEAKMGKKECAKMMKNMKPMKMDHK